MEKRPIVPRRSHRPTGRPAYTLPVAAPQPTTAAVTTAMPISANLPATTTDRFMKRSASQPASQAMRMNGST